MRKYQGIAWRRLVLVALGMLVTADAGAAPINYGDLAGVSVIFRTVIENSFTDPTPLYGPPLVVNDSLVFTPPGFIAEGEDAGMDNTDGLVTTFIDAKPGNYIHQILVQESGEFTLVDFADQGTSDTYVVGGAAVFVKVYEVDGAPITPFTVSANLVFSPSDTHALPVDAGLSQPWTATATIDVDAELANRGFTGLATKVTLWIDNDLTAISETDTLASIRKDEVIIGIVPEPTGASLLVAGAVLVASRRRRC